MKKNSTWRALLFSMFSMLICATMLIGSTWAWFTATASIGTNAILTGSLDIEIVDVNDNKITQPLQFLNTANDQNILWEPNAAYRTAGFKIKNTGNLSLKYTLSVSIPEGMLSDVLQFSLVTISADQPETDLQTLMISGVLAPGASSETLYIKGYMSPTATSQYQSQLLNGLLITVNATQATIESDSYGNVYDQGAQFDPSAGLGNEDADAGEDDASE